MDGLRSGFGSGFGSGESVGVKKWYEWGVILGVESGELLSEWGVWRGYVVVMCNGFGSVECEVWSD